MELILREDILWKFWQRRTLAKKDDDTSWNEQMHHLSQLGIGMEEALRYLYTNNPAFETFVGWINDRCKPVISSAFHDRVFSDDDLHFWETNGYVLLRNAVPPEQCDAARDAIWELLDAAPDNPATWYKQHDAKNGMMLSFFDHPAFDTNRRSSKIRKAYSELYGDMEIYLLMDKVSFNPPETRSFKFTGSSLHWDVSLQTPIPFELQGLLYLNDVTADDGAFHCVPGFHKKIEDWLKMVPESANPREFALKELQPVPVPGNAGDLVIWHQALPHCATPNKGTMPRMVQYIAYKPVKAAAAAMWK